MYSQYRFTYNTPAGKRYINWVLAKIINSKISVTQLEEKGKESFADIIPVKIKTNSHWKVTTNLKKMHDGEKLQEFLMRRKKQRLCVFSWSCRQYPSKPITGGWHPRFLKLQEKEPGGGAAKPTMHFTTGWCQQAPGFLTHGFSLWIHLPLSVMHDLPWTCHFAWEANKDQIHHSKETAAVSGMPPLALTKLTHTQAPQCRNNSFQPALERKSTLPKALPSLRPTKLDEGFQPSQPYQPPAQKS